MDGLCNIAWFMSWPWHDKFSCVFGHLDRHMQYRPSSEQCDMYVLSIQEMLYIVSPPMLAMHSDHESSYLYLLSVTIIICVSFHSNPLINNIMQKNGRLYKQEFYVLWQISRFETDDWNTDWDNGRFCSCTPQTIGYSSVKCMTIQQNVVCNGGAHIYNGGACVQVFWQSFYESFVADGNTDLLVYGGADISSKMLRYGATPPQSVSFLISCYGSKEYP